MLTAKDLIARGDLAAAEEAASWADDWLRIADAYQARGSIDDARRCADRAASVGRGEIWPTRYAAERFVALGDRARAVAILDAFTPGRGYEANLLARAYREVLGDEEAAARCIEAAAARAQEANDLCDAAAGYAEQLGELATARALLERAERQASPRALWDVAIRWKESVRDPDRAREVLGRAVLACRDARDTCAFAIAWRSLFDDDAQVRGAIARAESLAANAADWIHVAEAWRDGGRTERQSTWDEGGVRRALEAALALSPSADQQNEIAAGFRRWLGEADRVAPATQSAPDALLDRLRARLTIDQLDGIARADYGMSFEKHRAALLEIHATGRFAVPLDWYPREVCELRRWDEGAAVDHVQRAFCCAILAVDAASPESRQVGELGDVLAPLVESVWALGGLEAALDALLERVIATAPEWTAPWGRAALALSIARRDAADPRIAALVESLPDPDRAGQRARLWRELARSITAAPARLVAFLVGVDR